ncbi:MAG TPA: DEAD/DEAH box helicase [Polyangiaceae bacterium]|jgi:ATP-dependent RNA helicase DeaD|nr:DEAD/DEAH box helicase [Polyangiaceae bacterium]
MSTESPENDAPPPTFDVLPLSAELRRAIDDLGYTHPTPVQRAVFEPAARGLDLVVQARTGTGKTAAFSLPLIDSIVKRSVSAVQALILCPTRELALQVNREIESLGKYRGTRSTAVYGGAPMPRQIEAIQGGAQIVVGTPGRVLDHLRRGTLDPSAVRALVLDESDEMLSMGFLPQITEVLGFLPAARQTLLFSATLPADIRRVAETRLKNPEFLTLSGDHIGALEIEHAMYLSRGDKLSELIQIIEVENPESAIIFCNTRDETKRVATALQQQGFAADWLNADLAQNDREKVMAATRRGELRFLVCTDVAARGIDISHLTHVINFDFPESPENYVHRTGRTGRAGRTGKAIALIEPGDIGNLYLMRLTYKVKPVERQLPSAREVKTRAETDLVRLFVEAFNGRQTHPDDLALARRLLNHEQAERVIAGLLRDHLGARPEAAEEATAARRAKAPSVVEPRNAGELRAATPIAPRAQLGAPRAERAERERGERPRGERAERDRREHGERARLERDRPPREAARGNGRAHGAEADDLPRYTMSDAEAEPSAAKAASTQQIASAVEREASSESGLPGVSEIYVSIGRRDGARPSDIQTILEQHGLHAEQTDYIRVRHRNSFVGVKTEYLEKAVSALNGAAIAGKPAFAEPARQRD